MMTGAQIRAELARQRLTHEQVAELAGINPRTVSRACKAEGVPPVNAVTLEKIEKVLSWSEP